MKEKKTTISEKNEELMTLYAQATLKEDKLQLENDLIELNDKFIYFKCNKFKTTKLLEDDKHAIGMFGMMKAIRTFDISKGVKFITYAARIIDNEILMELRKGKKHLGVASLEDTFFLGGDGSELRIEDAVSDTNVNIERDFIRQSEVSEIKEMASTILNGTEQFVFDEMIAKDEPLTQLQISEKLNLSQSYISRIKQTVKRKLIDKTKKNEEEENMSKMSKSAYIKWKEKGYKDKEIAEKMGVTIATLYSFKFENGLTKKHNSSSRRRNNNNNNVPQVKDRTVISATENKDDLALDTLIAKAEVEVKHAEKFPANFNMEQAKKAVSVLPEVPGKESLLERIQLIKGNFAIEEAFPEIKINRASELVMTTSEEPLEIKKMRSEQEVIMKKDEAIEAKENKEENGFMLKNKEQVEELETKMEEELVLNGEKGMSEVVTEMELALLKIEQYEIDEYFMKKELESMKEKLELAEQINNLLMKQHLASVS